MKKVSYEVTLESPARPLDEVALAEITGNIAESLVEQQVIDPFVWFRIRDSIIVVEFLSDAALEQVHEILSSALQAAQVSTSAWTGSEDAPYTAWIASDRLVRGPESKLSA
jgi:DNA recombination-dependent growth factor C